MSTNLLLKSTKILLDEIDKLETVQANTYDLTKSLYSLDINGFFSILKAAPPPDFGGGDYEYSAPESVSEAETPVQQPQTSETSELPQIETPQIKPKQVQSVVDKVSGFFDSQRRRGETTRQIRELTDKQNRGSINADEEAVLQQMLGRRDQEKQHREKLKQRQTKKRQELERLKQLGRKGQLNDDEARSLAAIQQSEARRRKNAMAKLGRGAEELLFSGFRGIGGFRGLGGAIKPLQKLEAGKANAGDEHKLLEYAGKMLGFKTPKTDFIADPSTGAVTAGRDAPISIAQQKIAATGANTGEDQIGELAGLYIESGMLPATALHEARRAMGAVRKYAPGVGRAIDRVRQRPGLVQSAERKLRSGDIGRGVMGAASYLGGPANIGEGVGLGLKMAREGKFDPGLFKVLGTAADANFSKLADYLRKHPRASQNPALMRYVNGLYPAKSINQIRNIIYKMIDIANEEEREIITKGLLFVTRDAVLKSIDSFYAF